MKTVKAIFLLSIVCLLGCTSTYRLRPAHEEDFASLNNHAVLKKAIVTFANGRKIKVENLRMTSDSTYWIDPQTLKQTSPTEIAMVTSNIKEVRFISRGTGALTGMLIVAPIGAAVGFAAGQDCQNGEFLCFPREELAVIGAISGAFWGGLFGWLKGQKDIYIIEQEAATGTN